MGVADQETREDSMGPDLQPRPVETGEIFTRASGATLMPARVL